MIKGHYVQDGGKGLTHVVPYYGIRFNHEKAFMSNHVLGLQVLIDFLGSLMWINIEERWLVHDNKN
jgi:hypothetical protein